MKVFKSLDFKSQRERIEPNTAGDYLVHLEDYESLNDLIRRSIRTKSKFVPEKRPDAEYDEVILTDIEKEFQEIMDRNQQQQVKPEVTDPADEQSEVNGSSSSSGEQVSVGLP